MSGLIIEWAFDRPTKQRKSTWGHLGLNDGSVIVWFLLVCVFFCSTGRLGNGEHQSTHNELADPENKQEKPTEKAPPRRPHPQDQNKRMDE